MAGARTRLLLAALLLAALVASVRAAGAAAAGSSGGPASHSPARVDPVLRQDIVTLVRPATVRYGGKVVVSGRLRGLAARPLAGELVELERRQAPSPRFYNIAHTLTGAGGIYRFPAIRVERNARFRVADEGHPGRTGPVVAVAVETPAYPSFARVLVAERYIATRAGICAFAVVDSHGRLYGANIRRRYHSASVVKSMLLVAYLRMVAAQRRPLDGADTALLYPMIHESNNNAASAVLAVVGQVALDRVAADAHMDDFVPGFGWWGFTEVSAADLARFFSAFDSLVPRRFDGYARSLLAGIESSQSWGIPSVARPEFAVYFKGGWLPESEGLVNQVAHLERPGITFSLAVLTQDNPSGSSSASKGAEAMRYGEQTIAGVTERLLGRAS